MPIPKMLGAAAMLLCTARTAMTETAVTEPALAAPALAAPGMGCTTGEEGGALSFRVAALVTDNKSEPNDIHLKKDSYRVGEKLRIFLIPANYVCTREGGTYGAVLSLSVQIIYRGDVVVDQHNIKTFDFHSDEPIHVIRINLDDDIDGLIPGAFALKATLLDTIGRKSAEVILPFTVAP